jgi:hypothetical protein
MVLFENYLLICAGLIKKTEAVIQILMKKNSTGPYLTDVTKAAENLWFLEVTLQITEIILQLIKKLSTEC